MTNKLIILAGGASSRMKKSTAVEGLSEEEIRKANVESKALIEFGEDKRPVLDYLLMNAEQAGFKHIYLVVGERSESFQSYYGSKRSGNQFRTLYVSYATQYIPDGRIKPFGTADAVTQTLEQYPELQKETFCVCNCDNLYSVEALKAMAESNVPNSFIAYDRDGLNFPKERIARFAVALLDKDNNLIDIVEKPASEAIETYRDSKGKLRVSMNIFSFSGSDLFPYLKNCEPHPVRNEKELPTVILNFCKDYRGRFKGIPMNEHVPDLTSKEDILVVKEYIAKHFKS